MIPIFNNNAGFVVGPNGEELRTPLQQIEKNKDDIAVIKKQDTNYTDELNNKLDKPDIENIYPNATADDYFGVITNNTGVAGAYPLSHGPFKTNQPAIVTSGTEARLYQTPSYFYPNIPNNSIATNWDIMAGAGHSWFSTFWKNTGSNPEYQNHYYRPYESHGWTYEAQTWAGGTTTGTILGIPCMPSAHLPLGDDLSAYWGQRIINASDNKCTITFNECAWGQSNNVLSQIVRLASPNASNLRLSGSQNPASGPASFSIDINPRTSIYVYGRTIYTNRKYQSQYFVI